MAPNESTAPDNSVEKGEDVVQLWEKYLKVPKTQAPFDGNPKEISAFRLELENLIQLLDITADETKLMILKCSLKGPALQWYCSYCKSIWAEREGNPLTFEELEKALEQEFGQHEDDLLLWERIITTHQTESILEYNTAFERAVREAKNQLVLSDQIVRIEYMRGLKPEIQASVACQQPKTWDDARRLAVYEDCTQVLKQRRIQVDTPKLKENCRKPQFKRFKSNRADHEQGTMARRNNYSLVQDNRCYNCRKAGHFAKDCRAVRKNRPNTTSLIYQGDTYEIKFAT